MSKAEKRGLQAYPPKLSYSSMMSVAINNSTDENEAKRNIYINGYKQAIEDIKELLNTRWEIYNNRYKITASDYDQGKTDALDIFESELNNLI